MTDKQKLEEIYRNHLNNLGIIFTEVLRSIKDNEKLPDKLIKFLDQQSKFQKDGGVLPEPFHVIHHFNEMKEIYNDYQS